MELIMGYDSGEEGGMDAPLPAVEAKQKRKREEPTPSEAVLEPSTKKVKITAELPELPKFIFDGDEEQKREEETRQQHQGRIRSFPHIAGNWPTSVFIRLELNDTIKSNIISIREKIIAEVQSRQDTTPGLPKLELIDMDDLHISLSRTFALREHEFALFTESLRKNLRSLAAPAFDIEFADAEWYISDDGNRSFFSLNVREGTDKDAVCALITAVDEAVQVVGRPTFYDDPKPHISILWGLGNITEPLKAAGLPWKQPLLGSQGFSLIVKDVICKIGHRVYPYRLSS